MEESEHGGVLPPGTVAPSFTLRAGPGETISSASLRGRPAVLLFFPAAFSPVCTDELLGAEAARGELQRMGSRLVGISVDGPWCQRAYAEARGLGFPLLSDFEPKGAVSRAYGAYDYEGGVAERASFVLDAEGIVRWSALAAMDVNPGMEGVLAAIQGLRAPPRPA